MIISGQRRLAAKYQRGLGYPARLRGDGYTQARDWISDEERWKEGYQRYNGGRAWNWVLDDPEGPISGPGSWQPTGEIYGIDAWNIQKQVEEGNPPSEW